MTAKFSKVGLVPLLLTALSLMGCERATQVMVKGGTTAVFDLSGSGIVECFTVFGPDFITKAEKPFDENFAIWKIAPSGGFHGTWIFKLGSITYGVVPDGYTQIIPKEGTPPRLMEGQKYLYVVETGNAPGASGYFEIRNSRLSQLPDQAPASKTIMGNGFVCLVPRFGVSRRC